MNKLILAVVAPALFLAAHAYAQELEIQDRLKKEVAVRFTDRPLAEVIQTLGEMVGVNTYLDPDGLRMEGVTTDIPVTINLTQPISLQSALRLILEPLRLSYVIQNEVLRITSEQRGDSGIGEVQKRFDTLEQRSREIAARLNDSTSAPSEADALRKSLRESVQQAFVTRQKLRRAELVEFKKRLDDLEQSLDLRDRISEKIIDRRVEELLDPKLNWAPDEAGSDVKSDNPEPLATAAAAEPKLDGAWELARMIHDGKESLAATEYVYFRWRFDTMAQTVSIEYKKKSGELVTGERKFTLDQTAASKHLTTYGDRFLLQAVYELKGDRLRVAFFGRSEVERPESFDSKSRNNAGPLVVFEFERAKLEDAQSSLKPTIGEKIEQIDAAVKQSVSDEDAGPVWGEAVDGLQLGVSGIRPDRRFKSGDTIRFQLQIRNVGAEAIRFEYWPPKMRDWIAAGLERTNGEPVEFLPMSAVRGGHKHFTETLEPGGVASIHVPGILVLGAPDTARGILPCIEKPEPGEYRLFAGYFVNLLDDDGKPILEEGTRTARITEMSTGKVTIHIDPAEASEAEPRIPLEISPEDDGEASASGQDAKADQALADNANVEPALPQPQLPELFAPLDLHLAHFEPGVDRTEHTVPGGEQKVFVAKQPFARILDGAVARAVDDSSAKAAIEISFGPESSKRIEGLTQQHLNKPVAILVDGKLLGAPIIRDSSGNAALITEQLGRADAERIAQEFNQKIGPVSALVAQSVSDIDAGPVWGEAVDGLQLAVSGIRPDRHFKSGDTIRFHLGVRNVGTEAIRFEYKPSKMCYWTAPHVENAKGEPVKILAMGFRGGHNIFTETLEPKAVVSIHVAGILVLGASDTAGKNWPRIDTPEPGEYKLRGGFLVHPLDADGKQIIQLDADGTRRVKYSKLTSGTVTIHID